MKKPRRESDSRPVRKRRDNATTDVFARRVDSAPLSKGDDVSAPRVKPTNATSESAPLRKTADDAVPRKSASLESAPIGLRKASVSETGSKPMRGGDFGSGVVAGSHAASRSAAVRGESKGVKRDTAPSAISWHARWRRALRRAGKVSVGAIAAALACVIGRGRRRRRRVAARRADAAAEAMVATTIAALVLDRRDPPRAVRAAVGARAARLDLARRRAGSRGSRARVSRSSPARMS